MRLVLSAFLLVSLAACQPGESVGPEAESFFVLVDADVVSIERIHNRARAEASNGARPVSAAFHESTIRASQALSGALRNSEDWRGAHAQVQTFLEDRHPDPSIQAWREISVASAFLPGHLVNSDALTSEKQEAIAYYATLLIENRQFGGDKVLNALDRLEGHWPETKLAEARQLVDAASLRAVRRS